MAGLACFPSSNPQHYAQTCSPPSLQKMLDSWSYVVSGTRTFDLTNPDLAAVNATERSAITAAMAAYYTNTVTKAGLQVGT